MRWSSACRAAELQLFFLGPGSSCLPWQQRVEVVGGGGIGAERRRGDKGCCLGPVLTPVMSAICAQAGRYGLSVNHSTCRTKQVDVSAKKKGSKSERKFLLSSFFFFFTLFPSESNNIGRALAHHLGDVQGAVGLIGYGDRAVNGLGLHLWVMTGARRGHTHGSCVLNLERLLLLSSSSTMRSHTSSGRLSTWPSGPAIPSSNMRFCSWNTRARQLEKETS